MAQLSLAELQQMARETFGRELTPAQAEAYRGRLPTMVRAVESLQAWEERLHDIEPATVYRLPAAEGEAYGAC